MKSNAGNETIARLEKFVCLLYEPSTKTEKVPGLLRLPFKTNSEKPILKIFLQQKIDSVDMAMLITNVSFKTRTLKLRCVSQTKKGMEGNSKKEIHSNHD